MMKNSNRIHLNVAGDAAEVAEEEAMAEVHKALEEGTTIKKAKI
jgi:hypothetical protein